MKNRFSSTVCLVLAAALVIGPAGSSFGRDLEQHCAFEGDPGGGYIGQPVEGSTSGGASSSSLVPPEPKGATWIAFVRGLFICDASLGIAVENVLQMSCKMMRCEVVHPGDFNNAGGNR